MAQRGDKASQFKLGLMYETGSGVDRDLSQAVEWYEKSAHQSYKAAQNRLTYLEIHANGFQDKHTDWLKNLKTDARFNEGEALFLLGQMYSEGTGVNKSLTSSLKLLRKAVAANIPGADAEVLRVEKELKQLQSTYMTEQDKQNIKPVTKRPPVAAVTQSPATDISINSNKSAPRPVSTTPADTAQKTPVESSTKPYVSSLKRHASTMQEPLLILVPAETAAKQEEQHPMDRICSGSRIFSSGCR